jgi:hypothetical protein
VPLLVRERKAGLGVLNIGDLGDAADLEVERLRPQPGIFVARAGHPLAAQRAQLFALDLEHAPASLLAVQVHLEREDPLLQVLLAFDRSMHPRLCFSTMLLGQLEPPRQLILQLPKLLVGKFAELFTLVDERGNPAIGLRIIGNAWMSVSRDHRTTCLVILNLRCLEHIT